MTAIRDAQFDENVNDIDSRFSDFLLSQKIPGGAVGIIRDNRIVVLRGRGMAGPNRSYTVGTMGLVGSISKTLTALGLLALNDEAPLSFNQSVNKYLPIPYGDYDDIHIRQLLSHTSGIQNPMPTFGGGFQLADEDALKAACGQDLPHPWEHVCGYPGHPGIAPRSAYYTYYANNTVETSPVNPGIVGLKGTYSNINYMLLGTIIDMITSNSAIFGQRAGYENFIWHRVCVQAEMLSPCLMAKWRNIANLASGYRLIPGPVPDEIAPFELLPYPTDYWGWEGPCGGWAMTIGDLCRLMIAINRNLVIDQHTRDEVLLDSAAVADPELSMMPTRYGHGVFLFDTPDAGSGYLHHGDIAGFTARYTYYESHDVGVALILNRADVDKDAIGQFGIQLRDRFSAQNVSALVAQRKRTACSSAERFVERYGTEVGHLVKAGNAKPGETAATNTAVARFLLATEGERGKRLLRHWSCHDYENAAATALEILDSRQSRSIEHPPGSV